MDRSVTLRKEVRHVTKQQVMGKIVELISRLETISSNEGKRTGKVAQIQESIDGLRGLLETLKPAGKQISPQQVLLTVYKTAEQLYSWMSEEQ